MSPISHSKISQIVDFKIILQAYYCEIMVVCQKPSVYFAKQLQIFHYSFYVIFSFWLTALHSPFLDE